MKTIILSLVLVSSIISSSAYSYDKVVCESKGILYSLFKKKAYKVVFDISDQTSVNASLMKIKYNLLFKKSSLGLADLHCIQTLSQPNTRKDDPNSTLAICHQNNKRDTGYSVVLSNADIAGNHTAHIYEINFAGSSKIAKLKCTNE